MYRKVAILMVSGLVCAVSMSTPGQEGIVSQLYGNGVHAYFAGQYEEAHEFFTSAIQTGTQDPRIYYFRGLTYLKLGREEEAQQDFVKGAELETADVNQLYPVGRALQRVQGKHRLMLEQYRQEARLAAWNRQRAVEKARYQGLQQRIQEDLQQQAEGARVPPSPPPIEAPAIPPEKPTPPPFAEQPVEKPTSPFEMPAEKPVEKPVLPSPFEEMPTEKPAEKPALPSPFEEQPAEKPVEKPALPSPFEEQPAEKPIMQPETPEEQPAAPAAEKPASPFEMPGEKPAEKPAVPSPFEEQPAEKPVEKPALPSPFDEKPAEKPGASPAEQKPPAAKRSLLRGLLGAAQKTVEDLAKPAGQTLEKVIPMPGAGVSPFPGMPGPKLDVPVPPPFPGLPGLPGAEPGMEKPKAGENPFEEEPAPKPAGKPAAGNPF